MHSYIRTYMRTHLLANASMLCICVSSKVHTYVCVYIHGMINSYSLSGITTFVCVTNFLIYVCTHLCSYFCVFVHAYVHTYVCTYVVLVCL